ncbi:MAG: di-trans,poly-cis-decaprenylcistransferase [Deltaproteobacteria bacterium]|nr:di-trans,poly-cis-decaprenylcistransferase [Deltaproteobacteria bacterium]
MPFYALYEKHLLVKAATWTLPNHIGIIMDGNRRFARLVRAEDVSFGHQRGAEKLREVLRWCHQIEIPVVTVWALSIDNFRRNKMELESLLSLLESETKKLVRHEDVHQNHIRVRFIGRLDMLPEGLREAIREVEAATSGYSRFLLNIAVAYSGREEITDAFRNYLANQLRLGKSIKEALDRFDDKVVDRHLYTSGMPEPDLIIRTSGEVRISGFLLWQSANSEYYFCDSNWPAFRKIDFLRALRSYDERERRFGK